MAAFTIGFLAAFVLLGYLVVTMSLSQNAPWIAETVLRTVLYVIVELPSRGLLLGSRQQTAHHPPNTIHVMSDVPDPRHWNLVTGTATIVHQWVLTPMVTATQQTMRVIRLPKEWLPPLMGILGAESMRISILFAVGDPCCVYLLQCGAAARDTGDVGRVEHRSQTSTAWVA